MKTKQKSVIKNFKEKLEKAQLNKEKNYKDF